MPRFCEGGGGRGNPRTWGPQREHSSLEPPRGGRAPSLQTSCPSRPQGPPMALLSLKPCPGTSPVCHQTPWVSLKSLSSYLGLRILPEARDHHFLRVSEFTGGGGSASITRVCLQGDAERSEMMTAGTCVCACRPGSRGDHQ